MHPGLTSAHERNKYPAKILLLAHGTLAKRVQW
jgi:hypothetical protein